MVSVAPCLAIMGVGSCRGGAAGVVRVERYLRVLFVVFSALLAWVGYEAKIGSGATKIVIKWAKMSSFVKICEKNAFIFNFFVEMFGLC